MTTKIFGFLNFYFCKILASLTFGNPLIFFNSRSFLNALIDVWSNSLVFLSDKNKDFHCSLVAICRIFYANY